MEKCTDDYKQALNLFLVHINNEDLGYCRIYIYDNIKKFGGPKNKNFDIIKSFILNNSGSLEEIDDLENFHPRQQIGFNLYFPNEILKFNFLYRGFSYIKGMGHGTKEKWKFSEDKKWLKVSSQTTWIK